MKKAQCTSHPACPFTTDSQLLRSPQFTGNAENYTLQLAMLGAVDVLVEMILYGGIGILAGFFHARLAGSTNAVTVLNYTASAVYFVLATTIIAEIVTG